MCDVLIAGRLAFRRNRKLPVAIDQRQARLFFFWPIINDEIMVFSWRAASTFLSEAQNFMF